MCGCTKNNNLKQLLSGHGALKSAEQLIAEGVAAWYKYSGPIATRLGHATGTRYSVNPAKCALLATEDYAWFQANRPGMFTPCPVEMVSGKSGGSAEPKPTKPAVTIVAEGLDKVADSIGKTAEKLGKALTHPAAVDITTLTVNDALPIIREADNKTLDVWADQENEREQGPRSMILTAIEKRYAEIKVEAKG